VLCYFSPGISGYEGETLKQLLRRASVALVGALVLATGVPAIANASSPAQKGSAC
jgi:hypothetical protein